METLGQLLTAHVALQLLPDSRRAAEFAVHALVSIPGIEAAGARMDGYEVAEGEWQGVWDELLSVDDSAGDRQCWHRLAGSRQALQLPIGTFHHRYGSLYALAPDRDGVEPYVPFLGNLSAALALVLDNRRQRAELQTAYESLAASRAEYQLLFSRMSSGFAVHEIITDEDGTPRDYRFLEANEAFEQLTGLRVSEIVGRTALEVLPRLEPIWIERYGQVALTGRQAEIEGYSAELDRHYHVVAYSPSAGRFATVFADVTERRQAEAERERLIRRLQDQQEELQVQSEELQAQTEELQTQTEELQAQTEELDSRAHLAEALNSISGLLHSTLDFEEVVQRSLDAAVQALGSDGGTIEMAERGDWVVRYQCGLEADVVGLTLSSDEAPIAGEAALAARPISWSISSGADDKHRQIPYARELRSALAVPLIVREQTIGCLLFLGHQPRSFTSAEIDFCQKLGTSVSLAIDNARLYEAQSRIALTLQQNLIHPLPQIPGLELASLSLPAYSPELVGGDFSDFFRVPNGKAFALIGDVMGKGIKAAGLTETVRSAVRALALVVPSPREILDSINRLLLLETENVQLTTALLVALDMATGELELASAGHPTAIRVRNSQAAALGARYGPPLGAFEVSYEPTTAHLRPGDALLMYTDGLTEARSGSRLYGEDRVLEKLASAGSCSPAEMVERLRADVLEYAAGSLRDDLQLLAVRWLGCPA